MPGFADVANLALQPSVLALDPQFARGLFLRDLTRESGSAAALRSRSDQANRAAFDAAERERKSGKHGFGFLQPDAPRPRYQVASAQQSLLDGVLRQNAIDSYDRRAPLLRQDIARGTP